MSNINFANPWLLLAGLILLVIVIVSFLVSINKDNRTTNNVISFICHIIICILVTLAMAKTTYEMVVTQTHIYVLADVSYSSNNNLDLIDEYIDDLKEDAPRNSKIGVICFGKDYELLNKPGEKIKSVKNSNVDKSETNIASALEYANSLFKDNVIKRIVIISDGKETNNSNVVSVVNNLQVEGVYVDAIFLDNNIEEDIKEVQLNNYSMNNYVYLNDDEKVYVTIESNQVSKSYVRLYKDDLLIEEKPLMLSKGYNNVNLSLDTSEAGVFNYKVEIISDDDTVNMNNSCIFTQDVREKINILFIGSSNDDKKYIDEVYGEYANVDYFINNSEIPFTVEELAIYDEFIISNYDIRNIYNSSQFINSLNILVSEFGKSLITFGNTYIQNNEEDVTLNTLSEMLPVVYGNKKQDDKLIALVIDISRSMEQLDRLKIAKEVCYNILDNLEDDTDVFAVAFYGETGIVFRPTKASNREELKEQIENLEAYQGTFMGSALFYTYRFMLDYDYSNKEVILISDGLPYKEQNTVSKDMVKAMAKQKISVSTIRILSNNEGTKLMKELASLGRGIDYRVDDLEGVKSLILNEVLNDLNDVILSDNESVVSINKPNDKVVEGVDTLSNIKGLFNNRKKSNANIILNATYKDDNGNEFDIPLYTTWAYGNGNVSSYASTLTGEWSVYWNKDDNSSKFIYNVLDKNVPLVRLDNSFIVDYKVEGNMTEVIVNVPTTSMHSTVFINVKYPDGTLVNKEMIFDSINYVYTIETNQIGNYEIEIIHNNGNLRYTSVYNYTVSYLPEYDMFEDFKASDLYSMVTSNGKISTDGKLILENNNSSIKKYYFDFTIPCLIVCSVLFILDVCVRKLRLQDIKNLFKKVRKD